MCVYYYKRKFNALKAKNSSKYIEAMFKFSKNLRSRAYFIVYLIKNYKFYQPFLP